MSIIETLSEDIPIFMIRLVEESAGIMYGGLAHVGSVAVIWLTRSATSWRARSSSVPCSKTSRIEDSCATDLERIWDSPWMPLSCCSSGTVISCSTSLEELPRAMVWISTLGGANSGKTSTFVLGMSASPSARMPAATKTTSQRKFRLCVTIRRIGSPSLGRVRCCGPVSATRRCRARPRRPRWRRW